MGNQTGAKVPEKGTIELNFSSDQKITLLIAFHDPEVWQKQLESIGLFYKRGFKISLIVSKIVLSVRTCYAVDDRMHVQTSDQSNEEFSCLYCLMQFFFCGMLGPGHL